MRTSIVAAVVLAFASLVSFPVPAFADQPGGDHGKHFPMPAAEFKAHVDKHMTKARARMEENAAKLNAADAKELRAKFDATAANVNAEVAKATADGTVTADEARAVHAAGPRHGKHARRPST